MALRGVMIHIILLVAYITAPCRHLMKPNLLPIIYEIDKIKKARKSELPNFVKT